MGLGGFVLATTDTDWKKKWESASTNPKPFNQVKKLERGRQVFFLTFFSNPKLTVERHAELTCDFEAIQPNGTSVMNRKNLVCFDGTLNNDPRNMYLAGPVFNFTAGSADPPGTYTIRMTLKDKIGNTLLPLQTSFILE